jgi:hypothetical protein
MRSGCTEHWPQCSCSSRDPSKRSVTSASALRLADSIPPDDPTQTHPVWAAEDLVRRLCLALGIARRAIAFLAEDGYRDEEDPEGSFGPNKPFAETAMLLYVASAVAEHPEVKESIEELSVLLAPHARADRTACAIALHPTICLQLALPHVLLSRLGLRDSHFDRVLALSAESLSHSGQEVAPHRALERMWIKSVWSGAPPGQAFDAAALNSVLNHPLDLLWGTREDAYAHTHTFMYFMDFGYSPRLLPRPQSEILAESAAVLARSLLLEDYDLTAEVLMAWPLTSAPWSPAATFGFHVLAELEDTVGYLPAAHGTPEKFLRLAGGERTKYALAASYHTAYVMGMLCALALRPGNAPPTEITGPRTNAKLVDELLGMIPEVDTPWRHTFRRLQSDEQRTLGPFLLDMALLSRGRSHDFAALGRLLDLAVRHGFADTPLCAQSAELLNRMSVCADSNVD